MAWPVTRLKTFTAGGSFLPADANAIEDRMLQIAGSRGKSIIATEEARSNVAYGLMATPDQVTGIVMPTDGLICVVYQAMWKNSVSAAARAALFLSANQVKRAATTVAAPSVVEAGGNTTANTYRPLSTDGHGLAAVSDSTAYTGDVTTGQFVSNGQNGSAGTAANCSLIFAAAGTYDVSVQFRATSGSVTAKDRRLWVWTLPFA